MSLASSALLNSDDQRYNKDWYKSKTLGKRTHSVLEATRKNNLMLMYVGHQDWEKMLTYGSIGDHMKLSLV
jgi:hypothetical protein